MKDCVYLYGYGYMLIRRMSPFFQGRASYEAQRIVPMYLSQFSRSFFVSANFFVSLFSPNPKAALASSWVKYKFITFEQNMVQLNVLVYAPSSCAHSPSNRPNS